MRAAGAWVRSSRRTARGGAGPGPPLAPAAGAGRSPRPRRSDSPAPPAAAAVRRAAAPRASSRCERRLAGAVFARERDSRGAAAAGADPGRATAPRRAQRQRVRRDAAGAAGCTPTVAAAVPRTALADAATAAAQGRLHRLHARDRDRLDAAGHDDLHHGHRHLQRRWHGRAARARHQARRRDARRRCSRVRRACSCCGPRRARRPVSSCRSPRPGTDELGRAGLTGEVNRHFWERFGAAILISVIDGAVQAAVQSASRGERHGDLCAVGLPGRA